MLTQKRLADTYLRIRFPSLNSVARDSCKDVVLLLVVFSFFFFGSFFKLEFTKSVAVFGEVLAPVQYVWQKSDFDPAGFGVFVLL